MLGVTLEDFVAIATMSIILPGVTVKSGALVGAHSSVNRSVEPNTVVAGSPAKFICNTEEKSKLFKLVNFKKIIFSFQSMTKSNGYDYQISMTMSDYNNLLDPYTELEFIRIMK